MRCTSPRWDALENSKIIIILKRTLCSRKRRYRSSLTKVGPGCRVIILMWWLLRLLFCWILLSVFCVLYFCWTGLRRSQLANKIDFLLLLFYSPIDDYTRLLRRSDLLLFLQHLVHQSIYPSIKMEHNKTRRYCENLRSIAVVAAFRSQTEITWIVIQITVVYSCGSFRLPTTLCICI